MESRLILDSSSLPSLREVDFKAGAAILVDKPLEWTSFNVVSKFRYAIRHHLGLKRYKIGHAGTLDPLATGLLILCAGKYTKRATEFMAEEKEYSGVICLGASRPSYDRETEIDAHYPTEHIGEQELLQAMSQLTGEIMQVPPVYSAKQVDGKRAYDAARKGKQLTLAPCPVHVRAFELLKRDGDEVHFRVVCSKGTYIRSLAHDLGVALDSGAYLSSLRRTRIGDHKVEDALSIESFVDALQSGKDI